MTVPFRRSEIAALLAGVHPKSVGERLGHASVSFMPSVRTHVLEGTDRDGAEAAADLILGTSAAGRERSALESVRTNPPTP